MTLQFFLQIYFFSSVQSSGTATHYPLEVPETEEKFMVKPTKSCQHGKNKLLCYQNTLAKIIKSKSLVNYGQHLKHTFFMTIFYHHCYGKWKLT